ncbi:MAG: (2Fe-2S) ferredoxin domain-containing protein [Proteobacteria bacterium]|nr:(2Fe-2S) ferredoxin domain-containing protein [Pseudomonadota bacterium]
MATSRFQRHVFVCVNRRPAAGKPSCGARNSTAVLVALQRAVATHPALCGAVAVTSSGCLGPCFDGPSVVVYPDGVWYGGVAESDVDEIVVSHLTGGEPVERLVYDWPDD